jgi:hypothetical protein
MEDDNDPDKDKKSIFSGICSEISGKDSINSLRNCIPQKFYD